MAQDDKRFDEAMDLPVASDRGLHEGLPGEDALGSVWELVPKVLALVAQLLPADEDAHVAIPGPGGSAIIATAERVLVIKSGLRAGAPFTPRAKVFEYESVIGVRLDLESSPPVVVIDAPVKIGTCRVYWADSRDDAWKARNALPADMPLDALRARVEAIRGLVDAFRDSMPALTQAEPPPREEPESSVVQALPAGEEAAGVVSPLTRPRERCAHCRAVLRPGWRYCPGCGAPSESAFAGPGQ